MIMIYNLNHQKIRRLEVYNDYDMIILYHPRAENMVADTLVQLSISSMTYSENGKKEFFQPHTQFKFTPHEIFRQQIELGHYFTYVKILFIVYFDLLFAHAQL